MSQVINIEQVSTVQEANNFQREMGPVIAQVMCSAPIGVTAGVKKCGAKARSKSTAIMAPSKMDNIQKDFNRNLAVSRTFSNEKAEQLKVAALATLIQSQENILISKPEEIASGMQRIMDAGTIQEVSREITRTFQEIRKQHSHEFTKNVAIAVKDTAVSIGFETVAVQKPTPGMIRIVASNQSGQNLIAEIETGKKVDIRSELIGYTDGSCTKVMRAFDDGLVARGITMEHKEQKPTWGIPRLSYSKKIKAPRRAARFFAEEAVSEQADNGVIQTIKQ